MKSIKIILVLILLAGIIFFIFYKLPKLLLIKEISCESQYGQCNQRITEKLKAVSGGNLRETSNNIQNVLSEAILVKEFSIRYKFPFAIGVYLVERKPRYSLKMVNETLLFLLDKEGFVIEITRASDLPVLEIDRKIPNLGEKVPKDIYFGLETLHDLFYLYQVGSAKMKESSMYVDLNTGERVIFPLAGDRRALLGALQLILSQLNSTNQNPRMSEVIKDKGRTIDLRYKNPVIR